MCHGQLLASRIPTARKAHPCDSCDRRIEPGDRYENQSVLFDGRAYTTKTCHRCVARASVDYTDSGDFCYEGPDDLRGEMAYAYRGRWKELRAKLRAARDHFRRRAGLLPETPEKTPHA